MKGYRDYTFLGTGIVLTTFWLMLVADISILYIVVGAGSSTIILYLFKEHLLYQEIRFPIVLKNIKRLVVYILSLVYEIILANIQVAKNCIIR